MAAYKDEKRGTWFVSFHYNDWTGKNCRKVKRGFKTRPEAVEWEQLYFILPCTPFGSISKNTTFYKSMAVKRSLYVPFWNVLHLAAQIIQ